MAIKHGARRARLGEREQTALALLYDAEDQPFQVSDMERAVRGAIERAEAHGELDLNELMKFQPRQLFVALQRLHRLGLVRRELRGYVLTTRGKQTAANLSRSPIVQKIRRRAASAA